MKTSVKRAEVRIFQIIADSNKEESASGRISLSSITGCRKNLFSSTALKLPIEKIDAIMTSHNIFDSMSGGEALLIRSASGVVKFLSCLLVQGNQF